jgi:hypothetical protein
MPLAAIPAVVAASAISGGAAVAGGLIASSGAKSAAQTQATAAASAQALQEKMFEEQRTDRQPWVTSGGQAATTLSALMGLGGTVNGQSVQPASATATPSTAGGATTLAQAMRAPSGTGLPQGSPTPALQNGPSPAAGDMVTLMAPDGTRQAVPRRFMPYYVSKGATVVQ